MVEGWIGADMTGFGQGEDKPTSFVFLQVWGAVMGSKLTGGACCIGLQRESVFFCSGGDIRKVQTLMFMMLVSETLMFIDVEFEMRCLSLTFCMSISKKHIYVIKYISCNLVFTVDEFELTAFLNRQ